MVMEAVPDDIEIKRSVFLEAIKAAPADALLLTSTMSIPLAEIHEAIGIRSEKRLCGLRCLLPVVFIPFVEITLTSKQVDAGIRDRILGILQRLGKTAFNCDVEGAEGG